MLQKFLFIPCDDTKPCKIVFYDENKGDRLQWYYDSIGCHLIDIQIADEFIVDHLGFVPALILDDEGKLSHKPINYRATYLFTGTFIFPPDFIVGDVLVGDWGNDSEDIEPLNKNQINDLLDLLITLNLQCFIV